MSVILVLTPVVVGSWPLILPAVLGAAAAMGFAVSAGAEHQGRQTAGSRTTRRVERTLADSEILEEELADTAGSLRVEKDGVVIEFGRNAAGACTVCVSGAAPEEQLQRIADEAVGRLVQQFTYHRLMTELANRNFEVVDEQVLADAAVQLRVRIR